MDTDTVDGYDYGPPCRHQPGLFFYDDVAFEDKANKSDLTEEERQTLSEWYSRQSDEENHAKLICWEECPFRRECLALGIDETEGVWGGYDPHERQLIREGKPVPTSKHRYKSPGRRKLVKDLILLDIPVDRVAEMLGTTRPTVLEHVNNEIHVLRDESATLAAAS